MTRPLLIDLYCCAGGAAMGYHRAGFDVVGVDHIVQPHYPFSFVQADALEVLADLAAWGSFQGRPVAAAHASPPCQAHTAYGRTGRVGRHIDLIAPTRELLEATGLPWVIENVPGAPLREWVRYCGTSFPPLEVQRHRWFEASFPLMPPPCDHGRLTERKYPGSSNRPNGRFTCPIGEWDVPLPAQQAAIGIDWMTREELSQSIPPAYTEHIGRQLLAHLAHLKERTAA